MKAGGSLDREYLIGRFWSKAATSDPSGCWEWASCIEASGYGRSRTKIAAPERLAHRIAWVLVNGPIPSGLMVCHHCDNRRCCNPAHLFLGTNDDNMADMVRKGRQARGERHPKAKLSAAEVAEMRGKFSGKPGQISQLAREYELSNQAAWSILRGRHHKQEMSHE